MVYLYILAVIVLPVFLGVLSPVWMIYLLAFTGPLLIGADASDAMGFILGRVDVTSLRVVGSVTGAVLAIMFSFRKSIKFFTVGMSYILFILFILISLAWAPSVLYGLRTIAKLVALFFLMVAVGITIDDEQKMNRLMNVITCSCLLTAFIAIACQVAEVSPSQKLTMPGMSPAVFSANMLIGFIISLNRSYKNRVIKALLVVIYIIIIIFADTRITIAAMFVILSVFGFFKMRGIFKFVLPVASISIFLMLFLMVEKFRSRMFIGSKAIALDSQQGVSNALDRLAGSGRFDAWHQVLDNYFYPNMLIGSGIGTTQNHFYSSHLSIGAIHSEYVRLLAETGLIGTFLFLLFMFNCFLFVWRNMKHAEHDKSKYLMGICAIFTYLAFMATDNAFDYVSQFGFYIFGLIGVAIAFPVMSTMAKAVEEKS
jgi:O-antigen ligase